MLNELHQALTWHSMLGHEKPACIIVDPARMVEILKSLNPGKQPTDLRGPLMVFGLPLRVASNLSFASSRFCYIMCEACPAPIVVGPHADVWADVQGHFTLDVKLVRCMPADPLLFFVHSPNKPETYAVADSLAVAFDELRRGG